MASTYSTNLKIELQATGENSGTWGTITNTNLGTALEQAIVGYGNPNYASDANLTLTYTDTNAAQAARALVLNVTSGVSLTGTRELVVPTIQKQYIVQNNTTGSQSITVKTSAGTGITVPNGRKAHLYVNGTDVIYMDDYVDINGGAIDGTPIGANSASTGAFTTLSASGNITVSGGTANGVLYLDGSKVATSGSTVTFNGTQFSVLYSGASSATFGANQAIRIDSNLNTGFGIGVPSTGGIVGGYYVNGGANSYDGGFEYNGTTRALLLRSAGNTNATLTSAGDFGIGTTSPLQKLDVRGNLGRVAPSTGTQQAAWAASNTGGDFYVGIDNSTGTNFDTATTYAGVIWRGGAYPICFVNNSTERMRIDASGNLGLGVTPSASTTYKNFQNGNAVMMGSTSDVSAYWNSNATFNSGWKYISNGTAARYEQTSLGGHAWFTAASGTAGNTITFTQAMTLDASGNLGIGTTSPQSGGLSVFAGTAVGATTPGVVTVGENSTTVQSGEVLGRIQFFSSDASTSMAGVVGKIDCLATGNFSGTAPTALTFHTNDGVAGTIAERARITAGGELLVGTTTNPIGSTAVFSHTGAGIGVGVGDIATPANRTGISFRSTTENRIAFDASGYLTFVNGTTERARFTGANFLVGTTTDVSGLNGVISDVSGNVRAIPQSGSDKTTSYTLVKSDVGKFIGVGSGGSITVPDATFATGDVVSIFNNTTGNVTLTMTITTAYIGGTNTDKATITLATRGVATILFISGTVCVVNGNVS